MSNEGELYEAIADYGGDLADISLIPSSTESSTIATPSESTTASNTGQLPLVDSTPKGTAPNIDSHQGYSTLTPKTSQTEPSEHVHSGFNTLQDVSKEPKVTYTPHKVPSRTSRKLDQTPADTQLNQDIPPAPKLIHQDSRTAVQPHQPVSDTNKTDSQTSKPESLVHKTDIQSPQIASNYPYNGRHSLKINCTVSNLPHSPNTVQTSKAIPQESKTESQPLKIEIQTPQVISSDPQIPSQTTQADSKTVAQQPVDTQQKQVATTKFIPKVSKTPSYASLADSNINKPASQTPQSQFQSQTPYDSTNSLKITYQVSNLPHTSQDTPSNPQTYPPVIQTPQISTQSPKVASPQNILSQPIIVPSQTQVVAPTWKPEPYEEVPVHSSYISVDSITTESKNKQDSIVSRLKQQYQSKESLYASSKESLSASSKESKVIGLQRSKSTYIEPLSVVARMKQKFDSTQQTQTSNTLHKDQKITPLSPEIFDTPDQGGSLVVRMIQQFDRNSSTPTLPNCRKLDKDSSQPLQFENVNPSLTKQTEEITPILEQKQQSQTESGIPRLRQITPIQDQVDVPEKQNEEHLITENETDIKQQKERDEEKQSEVELEKEKQKQADVEKQKELELELEAELEKQKEKLNEKEDQENDIYSENDE
ncbi:MAG: hypothetical protein EZS28_011819 [Streblomastix strix]|uniref:Uncharacterized protein n=1 Tax=Streblomastix strix TaxID=222440 RepID=A0A5J4WDR1_9EUKA|nr:MAG: hypothetical protein EZS28_011819 [Streblomastix strix]